MNHIWFLIKFEATLTKEAACIVNLLAQNVEDLLDWTVFTQFDTNGSIHVSLAV